MKWNSGSLVPWFLTLLSLNVMDIVFTNPVYESNPFTLLSWARIGILFSALVKLGLVVSFGFLCVATRKLVSPIEWSIADKLLRAILVGLVAFYSFVVAWNIILWL